ncbi:MAG: AraC family transcriptional regulator [Treponema sp.]|nr:AraC family transcriptional regulator [Treponema sp.]
MNIERCLQTVIRHDRTLLSEKNGRIGDLSVTPRIFAIESFPDGARIVEDMIAAAYWSTSESDIIIADLHSSQGPSKGPLKFRFSPGMTTEFHKHNYMELACIVKGRLRQRIAGKDEVFNQGELCLLDKDSFHCEYLFPEESVVFFLLIANAFFGKSVNFEIRSKKYQKFLHNALITRREKYRFIRFTAKLKQPSVPEFLGSIFEELRNPGAGSRYLILGYTERVLNLLPVEYEFQIVRNNTENERKVIFNEVEDYLRRHYRLISAGKLSAAFGYNIDYFNRLIKSHTGMTYSMFLHHIRLETASHLLRTTKLPVEQIAEEVGYHNVSYFYRIFMKKYGITPHKFRTEY